MADNATLAALFEEVTYVPGPVGMLQPILWLFCISFPKMIFSVCSVTKALSYCLLRAYYTSSTCSRFWRWSRTQNKHKVFFFS